MISWSLKNLLKKEQRSKMEKRYPSKERLHEVGSRFSERHPIIPPVSIYTLLKLMCRKFYQEPAVDCFNTTFTVAELFSKVELAAKAFVEYGIKPGDIIVIAMPNYYHGSRICYQMIK